jgi:broad specificity phosphatase PhoE
MKTIDCNITQLGKEQSQEAGKILKNQLAPKSIDYMMISPLRRALQTASYVLESFSNNYDGKPIIEISKDCAEVMLDACDIGTPPEELTEEFPEFDFSGLEHYWWPGGKSQDETWKGLQEKTMQETDEEASTRIESLKSYLRSLDYETIVVVCHGDTIQWLTSVVKDGKRFGIHPNNGEILDISSFVLNI